MGIVDTRPTLLICNQCHLTRVADSYHAAKARAESHERVSKHYDFELTVLDEYPGRGDAHRRPKKRAQVSGPMPCAATEGS